jgi:hypothetical protein
MYYIFDTTQKNKKGETLVATYNTPAEIVKHLETMAPKMLGKTRSQLMQDAADLGFGVDDPQGKTFYEFMMEYVNCGVVRKDGRPVRCNIFTDAEYKGKTEHGD